MFSVGPPWMGQEDSLENDLNTRVSAFSCLLSELKFPQDNADRNR